MPRGIKRSRKEIIREEMENLKAEIVNAEETIVEKRKRLEELTNDLTLLESKELMNIIKENGLSTEDVMKMIETYNNSDELRSQQEVAATM